MADPLPLCAWLIGIRGLGAPAPGIGADLARLSRLVVAAGGQVHLLAGDIALLEAKTYAQENHFDFEPLSPTDGPLAGPAVVHWGPPELRKITAALERARTFAGHRLIWLGGHAVPRGPLKRLVIPTERDGDDELRVADFWDLVATKVGDGSHLVALLDTCHAGDGHLPPESRVLGLASSRADQQARGGPAGGAFTQALCDAIEQGHGTVRAARDFVAQALGGHQSVRAFGGVEDWPNHVILPGFAGQAPPPADPLAPWRRWVEREHRHLPSVLAGELTQQVVVAVELEARHRPGADDEAVTPGNDERFGRATLGELLTRRPGARLQVLGEPGSGKSTMARHLAWQHAGEGPVVAYLPAVDLTLNIHPFTLLADRVAAVERGATGIAEALERAAAKGELWLLIDGLDEVAEAEAVRRRIAHYAEQWPRASIVVLARALGATPLTGFTQAQVQPLDRAAQVALLAKHVGGDAEALLGRIEAIEPLRQIAGVPLLLSFIALVAGEHPELPPSRVEVYRRALDHFLTRGRRGGLPDAEAARPVLRHLAIALQAKGDGPWPKALVTPILEALERGRLPKDTREIFKQIHGLDEDALKQAREYNARSPALFLDLVADKTGLFGPCDGPKRPWRFLHKTLHDALCAEHLSTLSDEVLAALVGELAKEQKDRREQGALARWSEALAQTIALRPAPLALLDAFGRVSEALLLRCAPEVDGVPPAELVARVVATKDWDGEHLLALARRWRDEPAGLAAIRALVNPLKPQENYDDLETVARVHYALSAVAALGDEAAFFEEAGLPPPNHQAIAAWVPVPPAGVPPTFRMGSPEGVGNDRERPVHEVAVSAFELGQYPVTVAEFRKLAPFHGNPKQGRHPVTKVSWYVARLFAHWAGGRLPREAEWEFACRAGSEGLWCFGDDEKKLKDYAWFDANAGGETHPVGLKAANAWGLYDVHGNVWEWCGDWLGDYPSAPQHNPEGPAGGVVRVRRGGSWWSDADRCRSACRDGCHPASRNDDVGFRVLRPPVGS